MSNEQESKKRNREIITLKESDEVSYWQEKCSKIQRMRDEAENDLTELRRLKEESDNIFTKKITLLEQKLSLTSEELVRLSTNNNSSSSSSSTNNNTSQNSQICQNCQNCDELKKQNNIFELLSGIKLKKIGEENKYLCTIKNETTKTVVKFTISINSNTNEVEYEPISNSNILPEYMRSSLAFDKTMGPMLLADLLSSIYPQDDESNQDNES